MSVGKELTVLELDFASLRSETCGMSPGLSAKAEETLRTVAHL